MTNGSFVALDVTVTGALVGNGAFAGWDSLLPDGVTLTAQVKSAGLVRCLMMNQSGTSQTITAGHVYAEALNP